MRRVLLTMAAAACCVPAGALRAQETPRPPDPAGRERIVPVYDEPRHRQIFTSGTTRILELIVLPGPLRAISGVSCTSFHNRNSAPAVV